MSTLSLPFLVPAAVLQNPVFPLHTAADDEAPRTVRRRANMQQGKALEVLGHAIEYLVDSRMFLVGDPRMLVEADAVRVLSRCSRELFTSCAPVVPVSVRLRHWAAGYRRADASKR